MATAELLDEVVVSGYAGLAWDEVQRRLVERTFSDLEQAIRSGTIYGRCARARVSIPRCPALQRHPYPEDIAAEAVEGCLERFRTRVLPGGQWDPDQGTSLEDFFAVCCLPDVANRWRWYFRRQVRAIEPLDSDGHDQIVAFPLGPNLDPAEIITTRDLVVGALSPMASADQTAFVMLAAGWSIEEIARTLGISRDALYARNSRARKAARERRTI